jgi:hypothetical protein
MNNDMPNDKLQPTHKANRLHNDYYDPTGLQSSNNDYNPSVLICHPQALVEQTAEPTAAEIA